MFCCSLVVNFRTYANREFCSVISNSYTTLNSLRSKYISPVIQMMFGEWNRTQEKDSIKNSSRYIEDYYQQDSISETLEMFLKIFKKKAVATKFHCESNVIKYNYAFLKHC